MVKIEQLKAAKAVFTRNNSEQPVTLNTTITDEEFKTLRVLEGTVVVSINESEVISITVKETPEVKSIVIQDVVAVVLEEPKVDLEPKSQSEPAVETTVKEISITETVKPVIVKPVPRTRK